MFFLLACRVPEAPPSGPDEAPTETPAALTVLADGVRLLVDRDSIADAFPLGGRIVQRTPGGAIVLRHADRSVERVVLGQAPAAAIGADGEQVLVAWRDGATATLDPATGALTPGPRVRGEPIWIGRVGDPYVVALGEDEAVEVLDLDTNAGASGKLTVQSAAPLGAPTAMEASAHAAPFPVRSDRPGFPEESSEAKGDSPEEARGPALWLGWDQGEWGGVLARVDLRDGHVDANNWANINGLTRVGDQVLAYGGMDHLGMRDSWIGPVGGEPTYRSAWDSVATDRPTAPVHAVIPSPTGFTVLSFSDVFETDATLATWRKIGSMQVHYRGGRPDAVGTYASVIDAWRDADDLVLATRYDGFARFSPPDRTSGQAVAPTTGLYLHDLLAADGLVALAEGVPYRLGEGGLTAVPGVGPSRRDAWDVDPDGHLRRTSISSDTVTTTVWSEPITRREETAFGNTVLRDGVGALWTSDYRDGTRRELEGSWAPVELPPPDGYLFAWRAISGVGGLFRLHRGGPDAVAFVRDGRLQPIPGTLDATAWEGTVALLTPTGLFRWDPASDARSPIPFTLPEAPTLVARDGCGRLWVAGRTLVLGPDQGISSLGLDGRTWTAMVGLADGVGLTDGYVIAEVRRGCP